jgi:HEAT repeat protein
LAQPTDFLVKNSWIRILVALGDAKALPAILAALHDSNESVAANAIAQLARWPDPAPIAELLAVVETGANPAQRQRALASVIQLATTATDEHQRPNETLVTWFGRANRAAQTVEDRRAIISGLGRLPQVESFRLLVPYLDDPGLQNEAALAVVQIAPALRQTAPAALKPTLEKIAATAPSPDVRNRAAKLAATIPAQ